jgi:hypothetical protein
VLLPIADYLIDRLPYDGGESVPAIGTSHTNTADSAHPVATRRIREEFHTMSNELVFIGGHPKCIVVPEVVFVAVHGVRCSHAGAAV